MKVWILLVITAFMLAGWLSGCAKPLAPETLIEYRRSGGLLGLDDRLAIQADGRAALTRKSGRSEFTLDGDTMSRLRALFEQAEFARLRKEYLPPRPGADLFEYVVAHKGHTVRTTDGDIPPSLQPILNALNEIVERQGSP
jgi:hypothetical protein